MPAFSRTVWPIAYSLPKPPGRLISIGGTGKPQTRSPLAVGRSWEEIYPPLLVATDSVNRAWWAQAHQLYRTGTQFTIAHPAYRTQLGAGGGTPLVNGAGQTGNSINTDGWPNSTTVLKAGDLVKFGALSLVYELTADAVSNGSGQAALQIEPAIVSGGSPGDNNAVVYGSSVTFNAIITALESGLAVNDEYVEGIRITFVEVP